MQILLDDVTCELDAATVAEAVLAAAALARSQGRLVVDVIVDGTRWTEDPSAPSAAASVVALTSAQPAVLVWETFAQAVEALAEADSLQRAAAESLQSDRALAAMDKLAGAMAIWEGVREAIVNGAAIAGLDLAAPGAGLDAAVTLLHDKLEALHGALRQGDLVAVADALLYEFPEVVTRWRALLGELQQQVQ